MSDEGLGRTIVISADVEKALAEIAKLNSGLDKSSSKAEDVGNNLDKRF